METILLQHLTIYSQTCLKDHLRIKTTSQQRPCFWIRKWPILIEINLWTKTTSQQRPHFVFPHVWLYIEQWDMLIINEQFYLHVSLFPAISLTIWCAFVHCNGISAKYYSAKVSHNDLSKQWISFWGASFSGICIVIIDIHYSNSSN